MKSILCFELKRCFGSKRLYLSLLTGIVISLLHICLLYTSLGMGGFYQHGKRVKTGVLPLGAGAKVAERKIPAGVQGISKGPHMGKNGVCPKGGNVLHDGGGIGTESGFTAEIGMLPFQKADPDGANLLRGSRGRSGCSGKHRACGWLRRGRRPQYGGHYEKKRHKEKHPQG